jgi:hypothetical protein
MTRQHGHERMVLTFFHKTWLAGVDARCSVSGDPEISPSGCGPPCDIISQAKNKQLESSTRTALWV